MAWKDTLAVRAFGWTKIPMIAYLRPRVDVTEDRVEVTIPLGRRSKNHHGSMYFGALAVGADLAAGYLAMRRIRQAGRPVSFVFQDVDGRFLRRPTGDVRFVCEAGDAVRRVVDQTLLTGERQAVEVPVVCLVDGERSPVARFVLTLSVKAKG